MRLWLLLVVTAALGLAVTWQARADDYLLKWEQPDWVEGDTWEVRWESCEVVSDWVPLEPQWGSEGLRAGLAGPVVSCVAVARTTRDGVTGAVSDPRVYVPEPPWLLGVLAGCGGLSLMRAVRSPCKPAES